jgi:hypothetical protein
LTTPRPPFEKPLDVLERNKLLARGALGAVVAGPLMLAAAAAGIFPPGILGVHLTIAGVLLFLASVWKNPRPKRKRARIRADREGLFVDGTLAVPRAKIADGFFQPRSGRDLSKASSYGSSVRLVDKRRRIVFEAEADEREALDVLYALGLDPGTKRAEFNGSAPAFATLARNLLFVGCSVVAMGFLSAALFALGPRIGQGISSLLMMAWFLGAMLPSKIAVAIDGVHLRWLWWKKLVPMSTIAGISGDGDRMIRLQLVDGTEQLLYTSMRGNSRFGATYGLQHRNAVIARIAEAHAAFRARTPAADVSGLVSRGSKTREEWLAALAKLRDAGGGYRDAVVRDEDLWRVVEDPSASEDARGGAAMLLRRSLDDEGKARVRVAAEATASPKLRIALDAAAGEPDETFQSALDELAVAARERRA